MKTDEKAYFTQFKHACYTLGIDLKVTSKSQKSQELKNTIKHFKIDWHMNYIIKI